METIEEEWEELNKDFDFLRDTHERYTQKIDEVKEIQQKCIDAIHHQNYRMKNITQNLQKLSGTQHEEAKKKISHAMRQRQLDLRDLNENLPKKNGLYLNIVLGQVNVSLLSKRDKFAYKQDYERFKLIVTAISLVASVLLYGFINNRVLDNLFIFLLLWYYCTLTIREQILITNGSRIKGWWLTHHFISTICCGTLLIWPKVESFHAFRSQFMIFSIYLNIVQGLQYYYQRGSLYKMRALGKRHNMDITVDGVMSWMLRNMAFLLPFLFGAYFFQLYNAFTLYRISKQPFCKEWQVTALSLMFFILFLGNMITTGQVMLRKFFWESSDEKIVLPFKYRFKKSDTQ